MTQVHALKSLARRGKTAAGQIMVGDSLKARALRGSGWTLVGTGGARAIRLGRNLVLTRLLVPEHFGLMALVGIVIEGLQLFSDIGVGPSIIQNRRGEDIAFLNTAWTVQVIRGVILCLISCAIAWPLAQLYNEPQLLALIPVASLALLIRGFTSTNVATARRNIALARVQLLELATPIAGFVIAAPLAWYFKSIWALVAAGIAGAIARVILSHSVMPGIRNRFHWDPEAWWNIFHFGKWVFLATLATFIVIRGDRLIMGKLISMEMLGVYTVAFMIVDTFRSIFRKLAGNILFPAVSRRQDLTREELRTRLLRNRWPFLCAGALATILLTTIGDHVVLSLWDPRYRAAGWMVTILGLGLWLEVLYQWGARVLIGVGRPSYQAFGNWARAIALGLSLPSAYIYFGLTGIIGALALVPAVSLSVVSAGMIRERLFLWAQDLLVSVALLVTLGSLLFLRSLLGLPHPYFHAASLFSAA